MSDTSHMTARSYEVRHARALARANLKAGRLTLSEVAMQPPESLRDLTIAEVLLLVPGMGRARLTHLNKRAMRDGINLLARLGTCPLRTRLWMTAHVRPWEKR